MPLEKFNQLYLFSDGAYEFVKADGSVLGLDEFAVHLESRTLGGCTSPDTSIHFAETVQRTKSFADDLSLLEIAFPQDSN
jgi:sigma-B regulation protein RsbU (phosphoserine phosphatase)